MFHVAEWPSADVLEPNWNVAPTDEVWAVLERSPRDGGTGAVPVRELRPLRWGLVPSWAKEARTGARMINARVETLHEKPAFRRAFVERRCLLPADGFYEWQPGRDPAAWLLTCTIITTEATDAAGRVHPRMPLALGEDHYDAWLDTTRQDPGELRALLGRPAGGHLDARAVSTAVNDVRNNGPHLLDPVPVGP